MDIENTVRELAKSYRYQAITSGGENFNLLFVNKSEFTSLQVIFISYIKFFNTILTDISTEEVDEMVLKDKIYQDAYMYWRSKRKLKDISEDMTKKHKPSSPKHQRETEVNSFSWSLKSK